MNLITLRAFLGESAGDGRLCVIFSEGEAPLDEVISCLDSNESWTAKPVNDKRHRFFLVNDDRYYGFKFMVSNGTMHNLTFCTRKDLVPSKIEKSALCTVYEKCVSHFFEWVTSGHLPSQISILAKDEMLRLKNLSRSDLLDPAERELANHILNMNPMTEEQNLAYTQQIYPYMYPICKLCAGRQVVVSSRIGTSQTQCCETCYERLTPDFMKEQPIPMAGF